LRDSRYSVSFIDWLACACAGADERAARAVRASGDDLLTRVAFAGTAGHVHDFDDTFSDGVAHISAACAPAALVLAAELGLSLDRALAAYAEGFEAMAALAEASHPALYDAGWHPTAVCGPLGAAVAAANLLGLSETERRNAVALAMLRAGGTRGAFGSDGKAVQVGLAAAAGVQAALMARAGASVSERALTGPVGFDTVYGATWPVGADGTGEAIERNWIKLHPSCLGTHAPIEAASTARDGGYRPADGGPLTVVVHPRARQAAHLDDVTTGLEAKFSIQYCVAHTLSRGAPRLRDFAAADPAVREQALGVIIEIDETRPEFGTVLRTGDTELARVDGPRGSPSRPASNDDLVAKVKDLSGTRLDGLLDNVAAPAVTAVQAAFLSSPEANHETGRS
jgi:2-methylcitrate dehydratase PrpD